MILLLGAPAPTTLYTLSLHDALPILRRRRGRGVGPSRRAPTQLAGGARCTARSGRGGPGPPLRRLRRDHRLRAGHDGGAVAGALGRPARTRAPDRPSRPGSELRRGPAGDLPGDGGRLRGAVAAGRPVPLRLAVLGRGGGAVLGRHGVADGVARGAAAPPRPGAARALGRGLDRAGRGRSNCLTRLGLPGKLWRAHARPEYRAVAPAFRAQELHLPRCGGRLARGRLLAVVAWLDHRGPDSAGARLLRLLPRRPGPVATRRGTGE